MVDVIRDPVLQRWRWKQMPLDDACYQPRIRNKSEFRDEIYKPPKNDEILFEQSGEDDGWAISNERNQKGIGK